MKNVKHIWTLVLAALLSACSTEEEQINIAGNEVKVHATIGGESIFSRSIPAGNVEEQKQFTWLDQIGICQNGSDARKFQLNKEGIWEIYDSKGSMKWETEVTEFKAFYPYVSPSSGDNSYEKGYIGTDQTTKDWIARSDYMVATASYDHIPESRQLNLTFKRKTARVVINITESSFTNEFTNINLNDVYVYSQVNIPATQEGEVKEISAYHDGYGVNEKPWVALVAPNAADADKNFIGLKVYSDENGSGKLLYVKGIPNLKAEKSYTYNLKIGKEKVTIESVEVADWTEGAAIPDGEAIAVVTKEDVKSSIETQLTNGNNDIVLTLSSNPSSDVFTEIKNTLADKSGINLTLKGVETISEETFKEVTWLNKITLTNAITIGEKAFSGSSLKDIEAPQVRTIEQQAFDACEQLENVNLPKVSEMGIKAFSSCITLKTVLFGPLTKVLTETMNDGGIFKNVDTQQIVLSLSTRQKQFFRHEEEGIIVWESASDPYDGSSDHMENMFLKYTFSEIIIWDNE